ncbi:IS1595 family transposase [Flavobacterium psychrophilum]|uniref:IS1595 family transposase n=1 Tax=Flavobacterium psychrophilum TaxID=96345 RepID=UPI003398A834
MSTREKFIGVNSIKFSKRFKDDADCYEYLSLIKREDGFICRKCNYEKWYNGKKPFSKRCLRCKYDESPTTNTMFEKLKFPILIAFHIAFKISTKKKGMSSIELSNEFELRQKTCWTFRQKVQQVMKSSLKHQLTGLVNADEFVVGGPEEGKKGRSKGAKKLIVLALEIVDGGVGRAYAEVIENSSAKELGSFLRKYVSVDAELISDKRKGYAPLKKEFTKLKQVASNDGKNFKELHIHIMNFKGWLRGIHHHCSKEHMQDYLNEYHFRYNRRSNMGTIFDVLMRKMVSFE